MGRILRDKGIHQLQKQSALILFAVKDFAGVYSARVHSSRTHSSNFYTENELCQEKLSSPFPRHGNLPQLNSLPERAGSHAFSYFKIFLCIPIMKGEHFF